MWYPKIFDSSTGTSSSLVLLGYVAKLEVHVCDRLSRQCMMGDADKQTSKQASEQSINQSNKQHLSLPLSSLVPPLAESLVLLNIAIASDTLSIIHIHQKDVRCL